MAKLAKETNVKTPAEEKLIDFDFTADLDTGESIVSSPAPLISIVPDDVSISTIAVSGSRVQVMYKGGNTGMHTVFCTCTTNNGQKYQGLGYLLIAPLV